MIIDHNSTIYKQNLRISGKNRYNGAFYYSQEIVKRIIPNVRTDRSWITVNVQGLGCDHAIVFVHNNLRPENYEHLKPYRDLILVCGIPETVPKVQHLGTAIYLPLSVDVEAVKLFRSEKTMKTAFAGRPAKKTGAQLPAGIDYIEGLPRIQFLQRMARYENIYAVGRTAIEAKILGCNILPYDPRFPDPERWEIMDNLEAAYLLQKKLDIIDGEKDGDTGTETERDHSIRE